MAQRRWIVLLIVLLVIGIGSVIWSARPAEEIAELTPETPVDEVPQVSDADEVAQAEDGSVVEAPADTTPEVADVAAEPATTDMGTDGDVPQDVTAEAAPGAATDAPTNAREVADSEPDATVAEGAAAPVEEGNAAPQTAGTEPTDPTPEIAADAAAGEAPDTPSTGAQTDAQTDVATDTTGEDAPAAETTADAEIEVASVDEGEPAATPSGEGDTATEADADASVEVATSAQETDTDTTAPEAEADADTESAASEADAAPAPEFDLVRVETDGSTVIAGRAEPGTEVTITADGEAIGTATASARGEFVALVDTPQTGFAQELRLEGEGDDGQEPAVSDEAVIVIVEAPAEGEAPDAPVVVLSSDTEIEIIQPAAPQPVGQIVLDAISYSAEGAVVLSGRGQPGSAARIYANGAPIAEADIRQDGNWSVVVNEIPVGNSVLRVDEIADDGAVTSRAESPFQREEPEIAIATIAEADALDQIVVQPGNNLWTIARERYGEGTLYTQIFSANTDQIRDPDLIYPGQIFALPSD